MKKICLLLAALLCCIPVLSACGAQSSAESTVVAAIEARYVDFDYEAMYELAHNYNVELYKELLEGEDDVLKAEKDSISKKCDTIKSTIKAEEKFAEKVDDYEFTYEVRYCKSYDEDDDEFDVVVKSSKFAKEGYSDMKDLIDEVADVRVVGEFIITNEDGDEFISNFDKNYTCFRIDGTWYVEWKDVAPDYTDSLGALGALGDLGDLMGDVDLDDLGDLAGDLGDLFG